MIGSLVIASAVAVEASSARVAGDDGSPPATSIVVTGERVERSVRETSSSVVVMTEDDITATQAQRLDDLLALVPNVQMGSGEEGPTIRGQDSTGVLRNLSAFLGGTRPRVTVQIDGRPISYYEYVNSSAPMWEVERIEVYRSPQSTTQGRNSIAGAIFIETNDPRHEWSARARVMAGSFHSQQASVAFSAPVVADQLSLGISADLRVARMASAMADGIAGADIRRDDYGIGRVKALLEPAALPGLRIEASYAHTRSQSPQFEAVRAPFGLRRDPVPEQTNGIHRIRADSLTTRAAYQLNARLLSTVTVSAGDARIRRFALPGLGLTEVASRDVSAEGILRYNSASFALTGGVNWLDADQDQSIDITGLRIGAGGFIDRQRSTGVFSEAEWRPAKSLSVIAGIRFQTDRQRRVGQVGSAATGIALDYDGRFEAWLPKLSLALDVTPSITAGVLVQRAYNPGGTSISLTRRIADDFRAETLWNREAFVRAGFAGGRGLLSANIFSTSIRDAQRQQYLPIPGPGGGTLYATEFVNAPRARTSGLESEFSWRVSDGLSLRAAVGLLRTRVVETAVPGDATLGREFQRSPHMTAAGGVDWAPGPAWRISAQARHHGGYFSDDLNSPDRRIGRATMVDARVAYTARPVTIFAYARNLLNEFALAYLFSSTFGTPADPREVGFGIEATL